MKQKEKMLRSGILVFIVLSGLFLFSSCEKYTYTIEAGDPNVPVLFKTEIQPIFNANCIQCHGAGRQPDLSQSNSHKSLTDGGYVDLPAEDSGLYKKISSGHGNTTLAEQFRILYWIQQGAKNN